MTFLPPDWHETLRQVFAPSPFEKALAESTTRRWERLKTEDPKGYVRERRRLQFRMWCVKHHIPLPLNAFRPRLPQDPRFDKWEQRCVMQLPHKARIADKE